MNTSGDQANGEVPIRSGITGVGVQHQVGGQALEMDYNHPLFLNSSYVSGIHIISFLLAGIENFSMWFRSMRITTLGRNKLGLVMVLVIKSHLHKLCGNIGKESMLLCFLR